jgi:hypothetical protein
LKVKCQLRLETLVEHVSNPNDQPSLKDAYGCWNPRCTAATDGSVWDDFGDAYQAGGDALFSWSWRYYKFGRHWNKYIRNPWIRFKFRMRGRSVDIKNPFGN